MVGITSGIIAGAVLSGGLGLLSASKQAKAAKKAGQVGLEASEASIAEQRRQFDIAQELTAPRREAENEALNALRELLGLGGQAPDFAAFENAPGFQFDRDQAFRATERNAAARGGLVSGGTLAELQRQAVGLSGQNFLQNFLNPIGSIALGGSAAQSGQNALNLGVNIGRDIQEGAAARASGIVSAAGAKAQGLAGLNKTLQGGLSNFLLQGQVG